MNKKPSQTHPNPTEQEKTTSFLIVYFGLSKPNNQGKCLAVAVTLMYFRLHSHFSWVHYHSPVFKQKVSPSVYPVVSTAHCPALCLQSAVLFLSLLFQLCLHSSSIPWLHFVCFTCCVELSYLIITAPTITFLPQHNLRGFRDLFAYSNLLSNYSGPMSD